MEEFREAIKIGNITYVQKFLRENKISPPELEDTLKYSAEKGHLEIVKYLVDEHQGSVTKDLALVLSAENGHLEVVKYLVEECNADIHSDEGYILAKSARNGHLRVVEYLVSKGASDDSLESALTWSGLSENLHSVKYLVQCTNIDKVVALKICAELGILELVKYLVEEGVDIHANDEDALWSSVSEGHLEVIKYLVAKGADVHHDNETPLRCAAHFGNLDVVKYLVEEHNANIHAKYDSALRKSAKRGHLSVVKYLVEHDANIHAKYDYALRKSAENGHLSVVKYLLSVSADIHALDDYALRLSALDGRLNVVKFLVSQGANIHALDDECLRLSAEPGHLNVVKFLVENGANVDALNDIASTWSSDDGQRDVVKYFVTKDTLSWKICYSDGMGSRMRKKFEVAKYLLSIGVTVDRLEEFVFIQCISNNLPECAEFIVQFFPKPVPNYLVPIKFHEFCFKYGIVYQGSNYPPMEEEYKKRKEIRSKLKKEIYEKAQEILYRPGGIRFLLMEERFYENAFMKKRASSYSE